MRYICSVVITVFLLTVPGRVLFAQETAGRGLPAGDALARAGLEQKMEYFDDGKVRTRSILDAGHALRGRITYYHDGKVRKEERFDRAGNKLEEANFDEQGKLEDNFDGWAAKRWLYKDGVMRAESIYGEDGRLTERKIYNDVGDMVGRQYVGDGTMDDTEEFNRGSVSTHETDSFYDTYGHKTGSVTTEVDDPADLLEWLYF